MLKLRHACAFSLLAILALGTIGCQGYGGEEESSEPAASEAEPASTQPAGE